MVQKPNRTRSFTKNEDGNVALLMASILVTLIVATGASIDYAMAVNVKTKMQNALDAATTAICTEPDTDSDTTLRSRLSRAIPEFGLDLAPAPEDGETPPNPTGSQAIVLNTSYDPVLRAYTPSLETNRPTTLMSIAGIEEVNISVNTTVRCTGKKLELSLMLDVTGSMQDIVGGVKKMESMRLAAHDVVDIFRSNMNTGTTRIALVPFAKGVNLGSHAEAARGPIIPGDANTPGSQNFQFTDWASDNQIHQISNCVSERTGAHAYTDAPPSTAFVGRFYADSNGCMDGGNLEIMALTSNATALETAIDGYQTDGNTAGHIGTAWAWYTLSSNWASFWPPTSAPEAPNPDELIKATILLTDGDYNTQYCQGTDDYLINCAAENGNSEDQAAALCAAMKDPNGDGDLSDGIIVYAVGFDITPGSSQETLLKTCASDDDKWFFPYDGNALRAAFQAIGKGLAANQAGYPIISN